jgi:pimeloyl-ACP methyl ester carboxylesterase
MMRITTRQLSSNLHKISGLFLRSAGFKLYRWGPDVLKIGMWRKPLRSRRQKYRRKGPLVLIPGFADSPLSWLPTITLLQGELAKYFDELVLIEFPGFHGYLFNEPCFDSIDAMLEVFVPALDSLNPNTVIGHSLGGGLAAHYAAVRGWVHPQEMNLEHIILIAPSGVFVDQDFRAKIENRIIELVENGIECLRELHPALLEREGRLNWLLSELMAFASQHEIRSFVRSFRDDHLLEPLLPQIRARVDLIWGIKDTLIPPDVIPYWLAVLKQTSTRVVRMQGIGHAPQFEAPVRLTSILSRLLKPKAITEKQAQPSAPSDPASASFPFSAEIFPLLR